VRPHRAQRTAGFATGTNGTTAFPVRARTVLKVPVVWIFSMCIPAVLIALMTFMYVGSALNSGGHLHGFPVMVVNQDTGASVRVQHVNEGDCHG
jgi:uncharacterized phage infection (PIP) family protein YhgE